MDEKVKVTANADNDLLFRDSLDIKKKKKDEDGNINESAGSDEKIEYFTE